ncbi:BNR repeat-containing protein, partial [Actinomyces polynesiensis]|uniref:BNR repeat-containing protein n=1 Tax=Actinomyces polynesiensis TaxID=1325934 RepID=UPI00164E12BE
MAAPVASPLAPSAAAAPAAGTNCTDGGGNVYFFVNSLRNGPADRVVVYGKSCDQVLVGDWDGDGVDTLAVRRGNRYYFKNSVSGGNADRVITYGRTGDDVLVGDWDGDGVDTLAVRRGNRYYFKNSVSGGNADRVITYGRATDQVLIGDWDGDAADTLAVRRGNRYYFKNSVSGGNADRVITYGRATDQVLIGDWDGDRTDTLAVRRSATYYVKDTLAAGTADATFTFGRAQDYAMVGDWDGDGRDTLAVRRTAGAMPATAGGQLDILKAPGNISDYVSSGAATQVGFAVGEADELGTGWASNAVNAMPFRHSSVATTIRDGDEIQTTAYYDPRGRLVLARRDVTRGEPWTTSVTQYTGNVLDAHNSISLAVSGDGYLHVAWGMHAKPMQYARSTQPWSLQLGAVTPVTGQHEAYVTYPEFHSQSDGDLFLLYRDGGSGNGNLVLDHYDAKRGRWLQVQSNLIDGESSQMNPYWQATVDSQDRLQVSWVWRSTADVSSNHDLSYARSTDATGTKWERSDGRAYSLPISERQAEVITRIPQNSQLINQTSMTVDGDDRPWIVSYWQPLATGPVQYMLTHLGQDGWEVEDTGLRSTSFVLSGGGTKSIPAAR